MRATTERTEPEALLAELEVWKYRAEHPEETSLDGLTAKLKATVERDLAGSPLCTYYAGFDLKGGCNGCPLHFDWGGESIVTHCHPFFYRWRDSEVLAAHGLDEDQRRAIRKTAAVNIAKLIEEKHARVRR